MNIFKFFQRFGKGKAVVVLVLVLVLAVAPQANSQYVVTDPVHTSTTLWGWIEKLGNDMSDKAIQVTHTAIDKGAFIIDKLDYAIHGMEIYLNKATRYVQIAVAAINAYQSGKMIIKKGKEVTADAIGVLEITGDFVSGFDPRNVADVVLPNGFPISAVKTFECLPRATAKLTEDAARALGFQGVWKYNDPYAPKKNPDQHAFFQRPARSLTPWFTRVQYVARMTPQQVLRQLGKDKLVSANGVNVYERMLRTGYAVACTQNGEVMGLMRPASEADDILQPMLDLKKARLTDYIKARAFYCTGEGFTYDQTFGFVPGGKPDIDIDDAVSMGATDAMETVKQGKDNPYRGFTRRMLPLVLAKAEKGAKAERLGVTADEMEAYFKNGGQIVEEDFVDPKALFQNASWKPGHKGGKSGVPMVRTSGGFGCFETRPNGGNYLWLSIGSGLGEDLAKQAAFHEKQLGQICTSLALCKHLANDVADLLDAVATLFNALNTIAEATGWTGVDPHLTANIRQLQEQNAKMKEQFDNLQMQSRRFMEVHDAALIAFSDVVDKYNDRAEGIVQQKMFRAHREKWTPAQLDDTEDPNSPNNPDRETQDTSFDSPTQAVHPVLMSIGF